MTITVYQNHISVECGTWTYDSVDGDCFVCECAFLYLPGLMWTWPESLKAVENIAIPKAGRRSSWVKVDWKVWRCVSLSEDPPTSGDTL